MAPNEDIVPSLHVNIKLVLSPIVSDMTCSPFPYADWFYSYSQDFLNDVGTVDGKMARIFH